MNPIFERKSIRKFQEYKIEKETMENIMRAAMQAPSAANQRPWEFIIVENRENLIKLSEVSPYAGALKTANAAIIVLGNYNNVPFPQNVVQDLSACCENILLQIVEENLGGVWLGVAPEKSRSEFISNFFDLKDTLMPFAIIAFGKTNQEIKIEDRFDINKIHYENY